jgi:hypothetical protein
VRYPSGTWGVGKAYAPIFSEVFLKYIIVVLNHLFRLHCQLIDYIFNKHATRLESTNRAKFGVLINTILQKYLADANILGYLRFIDARVARGK